jgi:DNA-binding NtrC family response regulator
MKLNVYYLDDEVDLLDVFSEIYSSDEISITTFSQPDKAIAAIIATPPDLLLLDNRLPGTTGDVIAQKLDPSLPKALISGDLTLEPKSDFVRIFSKPFNSKDMGDFLEFYVKNKLELRKKPA